MKRQSIENKSKKAYTIAFLFTIMGALFIAISPIYFGFIFSIIFIIPIYLGLNAIKGRKKAGFYIAMGLVPLAMGVSVLWIRYFITLLENFTEKVSNISATQDIPMNVVKYVSLGGSAAAIILIVFSILTFIFLIRDRKIFLSKEK